MVLGVLAGLSSSFTFRAFSPGSLAWNVTLRCQLFFGPRFAPMMLKHELPMVRAPAISDPAADRRDLMHRSTDWIGLCWLFFVGLTAFALCMPFIRSSFWLGDEGILLHGAERLLRGRRLYIDFFEILPPGGFIIPAIWFGITGISIWSARLLAILTIVGIACFTYLACRQTSKHSPSSALVAIGWAVMSQGPWTQINYHWFTTLLSMVVAWAALASVGNPQRWQSQPLIAGLAAGAAAMVIPTRGALTMLAGATSFVGPCRQSAKLILYLLGSAVIPLCVLAYLMGQGALAAAFDDVILFPATRYASVAIVPFGHLADDQNWPLKYLFPVVALLTLLTCVRDSQTCLHDRVFRSCAAFAVAGVIGCFPRPDIIHIAFVTPLVCPLLTYCITRMTALWVPKYRYALAAFVIILGIPSAGRFSYYAYTALHGEAVATPRGRVTFLNDGTRELIARILNTPSSDHYFFYPYMPMLPFLTAREHVSKYDVFIPGYTSSSQYQKACMSLMQHASWLVIGREADPTWLRENFPAISNAPETRKFELALQTGFEFVARYGLFELRRPVKTVNESVCASIAE
jgi:hypothetical protein